MFRAFSSLFRGKFSSFQRRALHDSNSKPPFWKYWTSEGPQLEKFSKAWYWNKALVFTVFGITGSSALLVSRPILKDVFQVQGNWIDGPWEYRLTYVAVMMPAYSTILLFNATVVGQYAYFSKVISRMKPAYMMSAMIAMIMIGKRFLKQEQTSTN